MSSKFMIITSKDFAEDIFAKWEKANPNGTPHEAFMASLEYLAWCDLGFEQPEWLED